MRDTRKRALEFLRRMIGFAPDGIICASRYYPAEESWTKSPAWWHEIPISKIRSSQAKSVHILCEKEHEGFHYLRVPVTYLLDNLNGLFIRENNLLSMFLSADPSNEFIDLRGGGKVEFGRWLVG